MPNIEFDIPMSIISPFLPDGLLINQLVPSGESDTSYYFLVRPSGYQIVPGKFRSVIDSISQADGVSMQAPYIDGLVATMTVEYWESVSNSIKNLALACAQTAREMDQLLLGVLNSLRVWTTDPNTMQRYEWTPTGAGSDRLLTNVLLTAWPTLALQDPPPGVQRTFSLGTPFPYAIDITEIDTVITDGGTAAITNAGNAAQSPVMRVAGPTTVFLITDEDSGQTVSYDGTRPGAVAIGSGHYAEIDFFQGSIFLDGDGADLVAGLDPTVTDLFLLEPGTNNIGVSGADVTVLSNAAYV